MQGCGRSVAGGGALCSLRQSCPGMGSQGVWRVCIVLSTVFVSSLEPLRSVNIFSRYGKELHRSAECYLFFISLFWVLFFLTHKEINVAEFARSLGINPTLMRNYINGFKKPSKEREQEILDYIHKLGEELIAA